MRKILISAMLVMLSGCTTTLNGNFVEYRWNSKNTEARNDLDHVRTTSSGEYSGQNRLADGLLLVDFPLQYSIECNQTKTTCKHAIVKHRLEFQAQAASEGQLLLTGVLHAEMGRSLNLKNPNMELKRSIPDSVEVIYEGKKDIPFSKIIKSGEHLDLMGLGGVRIELGISQL